MHAYPHKALPHFALPILLHLRELVRYVLLAEFGDLGPACRAGAQLC